MKVTDLLGKALFIQ